MFVMLEVKLVCILFVVNWDVFNVRALGLFYGETAQYNSKTAKCIYFAFHLLVRLFMTL